MCGNPDFVKKERLKIMADVYIKKGEGRSFKSGGMWFYDNEIDRIEGKFENGDIIEYWILTDIIWDAVLSIPIQK